MGAHDHREAAGAEKPGRCAILTVSDSRTPETDESGRLALGIFAKFGHEVVEHRIVPNQQGEIRGAIQTAMKKADVVVSIGGTGASAKDLTIETVRPLLEKELPGFGELFRARSVEEIGTAAILSRAMLGVTAQGGVIACTPGSPAAVRLALEGILMNEMKHLLWDVRRYR